MTHPPAGPPANNPPRGGGTPFGQYRLIELLGRGGMGEVWRAHDTVTDRIVALKLLPTHLAQDSVFKQRFRREAHAAAQLNEPHVVPIHTYGEIDGRLFVDMRLIRGRDLQTVLADGPLPVARALLIIEQVAQALHAAHEVGLVHRDVKPSNILITDNDFAYLIDFGIARAAGETGLTAAGGLIGTLRYMAPERFGTGQADARSDIYALACVLYESLTGSPPFPGDSLEQQLAGHLATPPPRPSSNSPSVPEEFDKIVAKGMAKDPDDRYATTVELARAALDATTEPIRRRAPIVPTRPPAEPTPGPSASTITQPAETQPSPSMSTSPPTQQRPPHEVATQPRKPPTEPTRGPSFGGPYPVPRGDKAPRKKRRLWIPVAALASVVGLLLGGYGIWRSLHPPASPTPSVATPMSTPVQTNPATPVGSAASVVAQSDPSVVSRENGREDLFVRGIDGAIWHAARSDSYLPWESLGGHWQGRPDAASTGPEDVEVFARGDDNAIWYDGFQNGSWSGWHSLGAPAQDVGGPLDSDPGATAAGPDVLHVFARGRDNAIWHRWWERGCDCWRAWEALGYPVTGGPDAVSLEPGHVEFFALGSDGAVLHRFYSNEWSRWQNLGGTFTSDPGAVAMNADRMDVLVRGTDNAIWHKRWNRRTDWQSSWETLGGKANGGPDADAKGYVYIRGFDDAIYWRSFDGGDWSKFPGTGR